MSRLRSYLDANMVTTEPTCIVHGDVGLHNVIVHPTEDKVNAIIGADTKAIPVPETMPTHATSERWLWTDWEISTLGHPMIDLNYFCRIGGNFAPNTDKEWAFVEQYFENRTAKLPLLSKDECELAIISTPLYMYRTTAPSLNEVRL